MIIKSSETNKINLDKNPFILLYGKNDGLKNQTLASLIKNKKNILNYEEKEILDKIDSFLESMEYDLSNKRRLLIRLSSSGQSLVQEIKQILS